MTVYEIIQLYSENTEEINKVWEELSHRGESSCTLAEATIEWNKRKNLVKPTLITKVWEFITGCMEKISKW